MDPKMRYIVEERKRPGRFRKTYSRAYLRYDGDDHDVAIRIAMNRHNKKPNRLVRIFVYVMRDGEMYPDGIGEF